MLGIESSGLIEDSLICLLRQKRSLVAMENDRRSYRHVAASG